MNNSTSMHNYDLAKEELKGLDSHQILMSTMDQDIKNHISHLR